MRNEWLQQMDAEGMTALGRAFACGHRAIAEMLLRQEREDQDVEEDEESPLHRAARLGLAGAVRALLSFGFDAATVDAHRETALHKAVCLGHFRVVELLVGACDVNAISEDGMTPLHWAGVTGNAEIAQLLVRHGADPHVRNEIIDGLTAIEMAIAMGYEDIVDAFATCDTFH